MEKLSIEERLNDELNRAQKKIEGLEGEIAQYEYNDNWLWRMEKVLSEEENLGLPVPRLELRYTKKTEFHTICVYALVYEHLLGQILSVPLSSTRMQGLRDSMNVDMDPPFRDGAHILHDMWHLKLPGFIVCEKQSKRLTLDDEKSLPGALREKMEKEKTA